MWSFYKSKKDTILTLTYYWNSLKHYLVLYWANQIDWDGISECPVYNVTSIQSGNTIVHFLIDTVEDCNDKIKSK